MTLDGTEKTTEKADQGSSKALRQKGERKGGSREMPGRASTSFCQEKASVAPLGRKKNPHV